jgi:hypothetical protein
MLLERTNNTGMVLTPLRIFKAVDLPMLPSDVNTSELIQAEMFQAPTRSFQQVRERFQAVASASDAV